MYREIEPGIIASGPNEILDMMEQVFEDSRNFNNNSKYPPGTEVKLECSLDEAKHYLIGENNSMSAYAARALIREVLSSSGSTINAEKLVENGKWEVFYSVEYDLGDCEETFILPERLLHEVS